MIAGHITTDFTHLARVANQNGEVRFYNEEQIKNEPKLYLETILQRYLRKQEELPESACFAVRSTVHNNSARGILLPWPIDSNELSKILSFSKVQLVNEYHATAKGLLGLKPELLFTINKGMPDPKGIKGLIVIDDQFGETFIVNERGEYRSYVTEAGHSGFAPASQLETELWHYLYVENRFVEIGHILSRSGLPTIYEFLTEHHGTTQASWYTESEYACSSIMEMALSEKDEIAVEALDIFIDCMASEAANLALRGVTSGGIYLAGNLSTELTTALDKGFFMERFAHRGEVKDFLSRVPVQVVMESQTTLLGAASFALGI
jgi:glucokinase